MYAKIRSLSIRIDDETRRRIRYVAKYQAHSANSYIQYLIRKDIEEFEEKHGKIESEDMGDVE